MQPFLTPGRRVQVSHDGGTEPTWSKTGELFYRNGDKMMVVRTTAGPDGLVTSTPETLFEGRFERSILTAGVRMYDVSADGQRFLMVQEVPQPPARVNQIVLVQNWLEELKQRVPPHSR